MGKVSINNIGSQGKNETMYTYINKYQDICLVIQCKL